MRLSFSELVTVTIKGTGIDLEERHHTMVSDAIDHFEKFLDTQQPGIHIAVEIGKTTHAKQHADDLYKAEIQVDNRGQVFFANSERHDLQVALHETRDEIITQMKKHNSRSRALLKKGGALFRKLLGK